MQPQNYDFITSSGNRQKPSLLAGGSKRSRIIIFGSGIVGVVVLIVIAANIIGSVAGKSGKSVVDLVAYQSELKRVVALGVDKSRNSEVKNKALTASYTLESDYKLTVKIVGSRGLKPSKTDLAKYNGTTTDKLLEEADKANKFDAKYNEIYIEKLTKYKQKLSEIYPQLKPAEQKIIKLQSNHAKTLLGEPLK